MTSEGDSKAKNPLNINVGKEIDAALGDVIRGLLSRPSTTVGDLVADGIGILGDRVKRKRELNAQLGIGEVRRRLDADSVDMKDITPPKEEELHLLMNGMSLTDDESVRAMWAGLFAQALEPRSETTVERAFISILETLSPMDAKIIALLAFIQSTDTELKTNAEKLEHFGFKKLTPAEAERQNQVNKEYADLQKQAISSIMQKAETYGLNGEGKPSWFDNLMRQGIIERTSTSDFHSLSVFAPSIRREEDIERAIAELHENLKKMQEVSKRQISPPERIFAQHRWGRQLVLEVELTAFGRRFVAACGVE